MTQPIRRSDASRNHEAILSAAIEVLARDPGASMQDVADASGTGRTTLYRHFPDRDALLGAAHGRVVAEAEAIAGRVLGGPGDPVEVITDLCVELASLGDRYRFLEQAAHLKAGRPADERDAALLGFLGDAQQQGAIRGDLDAAWLYDVIVGLITQAARSPAPDPGRREHDLRLTLAGVLRV